MRVYLLKILCLLQLSLQYTNLIIQVPLLPPNYFDSVTTPEFKYRFQVELECIAKIHDEKKAESERRELEAWKALEQRRTRKISNGHPPSNPVIKQILLTLTH